MSGIADKAFVWHDQTNSRPAENTATERLKRYAQRPDGMEYRRMDTLVLVGALTLTNIGWGTAMAIDLADLYNPSASTIRRPRIRCTTAASTGSTCGMKPGGSYGGNGEHVRGEWYPFWFQQFTTGASLAQYRGWHGYSSASLDAVASPTTQHVAAFRYDTGQDGTAFWRCVTCNGASGVTVTTTTQSIATATDYELLIEIRNTTEVEFFINGVSVAVHTTNLPDATALLSPCSRVGTLQNVAVKGNFGDLRCGFR